MGQVRWGILGTGRIVRTGFLPGLRQIPHNTVKWIGSRHKDSGSQLAADEGLSAQIGTYDAVIAAEDVDAVYIALPNHLHAEWTVKAIQAGKAVLCEKPLGLDADQVQTIIEQAHLYRVPVWTAYAFSYQPQWANIRDLVDSGRIGSVQAIEGTFTTRLTRAHDIRWTEAEGGGSLYDVGCYPIHFTSLLIRPDGVPEATVAMSSTRGDVDESVSAIVRYGSGVQLTMKSSFVSRYDTFTRIVGDKGEMWVENTYHPQARHHVWVIADEGRSTYQWATQGPSFTDMLNHISKAIGGQIDSTHTVGDSSLATARVIDAIHASLSRS